jgi:hypothetical protein
MTGTYKVPLESNTCVSDIQPRLQAILFVSVQSGSDYPEYQCEQIQTQNNQQNVSVKADSIVKTMFVFGPNATVTQQ